MVGGYLNSARCLADHLHTFGDVIGGSFNKGESGKVRIPQEGGFLATGGIFLLALTDAPLVYAVARGAWWRVVCNFIIIGEDRTPRDDIMYGSRLFPDPYSTIGLSLALSPLQRFLLNTNAGPRCSGLLRLLRRRLASPSTKQCLHHD